MRTEKFWSKVYDVLVEECHADGQHGRNEFVRQQMDKDYPREWRFCGSLGFGGKFWRNDGRMYVGCYQEDETPSRRLTIDAANKRLEQLARKVSTWRAPR